MNCYELLVIFAIIGFATCGVVPASNKTLCQEHREREQKSSNVAKLVPECDENGDYKPKACYGESVNGKPFCICFAKNGDVVKSPSRNTAACACYVEQHEATKPPLRKGAFKPSCEKDGTYSKKQCHSSTGMCWCSLPDGKRKTEPSREEVKCA
ncbi:putative neurotoxin LTDF S-18-like protein [Leptotrombidium deliense]|uniref:Putative neurotoxin LTDF S-18-like protein n=1 Tax=Leptotrombidium deliense TaxID=299467 RepID=A0A443SMX1_9ACAR|nr:putative neurotoxin LTDF S-18-like protein [Leptotrombidium deliense]